VILLVAVVGDPLPHPSVSTDMDLLVHQTELDNTQSKIIGASHKTGCIFKEHKQIKLLPAP